MNHKYLVPCAVIVRYYNVALPCEDTNYTQFRDGVAVSHWSVTDLMVSNMKQLNLFAGVN